MPQPFADRPSTDIAFVIKNTGLRHRSVKVFNQSIPPNTQFDLMKEPGITEEDIRTALTKSTIQNLFSSGEIVILNSTVDFTTSSPSHNAFLISIGAVLNPTVQSAWFINPVSGSDVNLGTVSSSPLKTWAELNRRWGKGNIFNPPDILDPQGSGITAPFLDVHIVGGDLPQTDPITYDIVLGQDVLFRIYGDTPTAVYHGTFTSTTAVNRAANTANQVTDTGRGSRTWTTDLNRRLRVTSGANSGATMFVVKDLGTNQARISNPVVVTTSPNLSITSVTLNTSDPYVVETLQNVFVGSIKIGADTSDNITTSVLFVDLNVNRGVSGASSMELWSTPGLDFEFDRCIISPDITTPGSCVLQFYGSQFFNSGWEAACSFYVVASLVTGGGINQVFTGGFAVFDQDTLFQGQGLIINPGSVSTIGTCGFFDVVGGPLNSHGDGIVINTGALSKSDTFFDTTHAIYGQGNAGVGIRVQSFAGFGYATNIPTVTGTAGNFILGGATSARAWNDITGAYTSNITLTWSHLGAAIASSGFGGNAINLTSQSWAGKVV